MTRSLSLRRFGSHAGVPLALALALAVGAPSAARAQSPDEINIARQTAGEGLAAYKAGAVEGFVIRNALRAISVILANIVVGENVVPEFIQRDCTPENLLPALREVLADSAMRRRQLAAFARIDAIMSTGNQPPSVRAADIVLATMRKSRRPV